MPYKKILSLILFVLFTVGETGAQDHSPDPAESGRLAGVLAGGSITGSSANTLGGWGHFSLGAAGSAANPSFDRTDITAYSVSGTLRAGVCKGVDMGPAVHGLGSVDLYLRAGRLYLNGANNSNSGFWGTGARVGILRNSIMTPALSVSLGYTRARDIPLANALSSQLPAAQKTAVSCTALRADLSKNFFWITPIAGVGVNRNALSQTVASAEIETKETEMVYYAGVEWNILLFRLGLEVGRTGGETFGSLGLRFAN